MHSLTHMLWLKVQGISVAHFSKTVSSLRHVLVRCSFRSFTSCRFISYLFSVTTFSVIDFVGEDQIKPCPSAHWSGMSGCLANPTPNTGKDPNFCAYHQRGAHADQTSLTETGISRAMRTPPKSPPQRTPKDFNILENPAAASIPQQAEFPQC